MRLDFKSDKSRQAAKRLIEKSKTEEDKPLNHSFLEAFMLLIKGVGKKDLDNLCNELQKIYTELSEDDIYDLTQGKGDIFNNNPRIVASVIYKCANNCMNAGKYMGSNTINAGQINTSSWISHSIYEAQLAENIAEKLGLNKEKAMTLGILHDYGRKYTHTFEHVTVGFEKLVELGWEDEAIAAIVHSFIDGGRCANCDQAEEGFYIDEEGNAKWENEDDKDEVTKFLELYKYSIYDDILNIADLMATDKGIVSPEDRVKDIATRKKPEPKNRKFFLSKFINKMNEIMKKAGKKYEIEHINAKSEDNEIIKLFKKASDRMFEFYKEQLTR